jgi:uncharacterized protein YkwD
VTWLTQLLRSLGWERQAKRPTPPNPAPRPDPPPVTNLVAIINETRAAHGIGPVWEFKALDEAAKIQADWQAQTDTLRHDGPPALTTHVERMARVGIKADWSNAGEVCAMGQKAYWPHTGELAIDYTFRDACKGWLGSPGHRKHLLDPAYTHAGAWETTAASGRIYSTAVFIRAAK